MASTYDLIETTTLASAASSVTFSSITQDYRDLVLVVDANSTTGNCLLRLVFNNDQTNNYYQVYMSAAPSSASLTQGFIDTFINPNDAEESLAIFQIMDYSATDKHKTVLIRSGRPDVSQLFASAQRWGDTSAITEIDINSALNAFASGSTFSLYGIAS